ncbi:unnamed protein product [Lactuca saligna]|uniref:Uncharacterized protein n=1 Tax=Lactuca saligna TaxID=75948 RepID=A0AA35Z422_LACSI|nr:unnamed protein product [Lactuca saligna]
MLKCVDPTNTVLVNYLQTIDTTIETGILLAREETRSKRTKKTETGSSKKPINESKSKKIPKKQPIAVEEPVTHEVSIADTNLIKHVTHQGILFREILAPVSPSSKKRRAEYMAKHISKKKKKTSTMIISTESTNDEDERIPETPEANLQKDTSTPSQTVVIPPEDSVA